MDVRLPGIYGFEVCHRIRADPQVDRGVLPFHEDLCKHPNTPLVSNCRREVQMSCCPSLSELGSIPIFSLLLGGSVSRLLTPLASCVGLFVLPLPARAEPVPLIPRSVLFGNPEKAAPQISPDGKKLAYLAPEKGVMNVWVRTIGQRMTAPLPQTAVVQSASSTGRATARTSSTHRTRRGTRTSTCSRPT